MALQPSKMTAREDDAVTVTLAAIELKPHTMDLSAEDVHKEFTVFKMLT